VYNTLVYNKGDIMAWQSDIINLVRVLINDLSDNPSYNDDRLTQVITVAARYVQFDVQLETEYNIDSINNIITPDPTANNDEIFLCLVSLKAACIIDQSNFRTRAALEGVRAGLGPAQLAISNHLSGFKEIIQHGPCQLYTDLSEHWDIQQATSVAAILSPFVGNKFDPFMLIAYDNHRHKNMF